MRYVNVTSFSHCRRTTVSGYYPPAVHYLNTNTGSASCDHHGIYTSAVDSYEVLRPITRFSTATETWCRARRRSFNFNEPDTLLDLL